MLAPARANAYAHRMKCEMSSCIALGVGDRREAANFYAQNMGFELVRETDEWTEMRSGPFRIFLCQDDVMEVAFALNTDDFEAQAERLKAAGCKEEFKIGAEYFLRDPYGYLFAVGPEGG